MSFTVSYIVINSVYQTQCVVRLYAVQRLFVQIQEQAVLQEEQEKKSKKKKEKRANEFGLRLRAVELFSV
jgi:hypothetical protein